MDGIFQQKIVHFCNSVIAQTIIIHKKLIIIQMDLLNKNYSNFVTVIVYREILADILN